MIFADASALVALVAREADALALAACLARDTDRLISAVAAWETAAGLCRGYGLPPGDARARIALFLETARFRFVPVGEREYALALEAYGRFGKGRHPAGLNMGDCFAYACAKANGARLLYKGGDFSRTDIPAALAIV
jgi:ribonuclease VapC